MSLQPKRRWFMNTNREQLINELAKLYDDIDQCIGDIVDSRLKKDHQAEVT